MSAHVKNWERIAETTKNIYYPEDQYDVLEKLQQTTHGIRVLFVVVVAKGGCSNYISKKDALHTYEASWSQIKEIMLKYDQVIKSMARKITERDNTRVDFDRARTKWEKSNNDPVCEATARAAEGVYNERNHQTCEALDYFLATRLQNMDAILGLLSQATVSLYSSCSTFPSFTLVPIPTNEITPTHYSGPASVVHCPLQI